MHAAHWLHLRRAPHNPPAEPDESPNPIKRSRVVESGVENRRRASLWNFGNRAFRMKPGCLHPMKAADHFANPRRRPTSFGRPTLPTSSSSVGAGPNDFGSRTSRATSWPGSSETTMSPPPITARRDRLHQRGRSWTRKGVGVRCDLICVIGCERRRRLRDRFAGTAGELLAHVLDHFPLTWDELQRLGHVLADLEVVPPQHGDAAGQRIDNAFARQMIG